jgi:hypothetical protein
VRARRAWGTAVALGALRPCLALDTASDLQRQEDVGGSGQTLDLSRADPAASLAEGELLVGFARFAGFGLLGTLLFDDLGHG